MKRKSAIVLTLLLLAVPAMLLSADLGKRDILRVGEAEFTSDTEFTVTLEVIHDENIAAMDLPLTFTEGVILTEVTFEDTRVSDFDERIVNIDNENNRFNIGLINMVYAPKDEPVLKPTSGSNAVAVLHFRLENISLETMEIGQYQTDAPYHELMFVYNDWNNGVPSVSDLVPALEGATVSLASRTPSAMLPTEFELSQNMPNPFNPSTQINFALPSAAKVNLTVFNVLGQQVKTLVDEYMTAGYQTVTWDGRDNSGASVASGVYFYRIAAGDFAETKKMLLLK
jgi:hypothetical protein